MLFLRRLKAENERRQNALRKWSEDVVALERADGRGPSPQQRQWLKGLVNITRSSTRLRPFTKWLEDASKAGREGDERVTFVYGL
jgi:hypothetical protein